MTSIETKIKERIARNEEVLTDKRRDPEVLAEAHRKLDAKIAYDFGQLREKLSHLASTAR